jgi:hypothetical protein
LYNLRSISFTIVSTIHVPLMTVFVMNLLLLNMETLIVLLFKQFLIISCKHAHLELLRTNVMIKTKWKTFTCFQMLLTLFTIELEISNLLETAL